jgi:hypothetical protein
MPLEYLVKQHAVEETAEPDPEQAACGPDGGPGGGVTSARDRAPTEGVLSTSSRRAHALLAERHLHRRLELGPECRCGGAFLSG